MPLFPYVQAAIKSLRREAPDEVNEYYFHDGRICAQYNTKKKFDDLPVAEKWSGKYDYLLDEKKGSFENSGNNPENAIDPRLRNDDLYKILHIDKPEQPAIKIIKAMQHANHIDTPEAEPLRLDKSSLNIIASLAKDGRTVEGRFGNQKFEKLPEDIAITLLQKAIEDVEGMTKNEAIQHLQNNWGSGQNIEGRKLNFLECSIHFRLDPEPAAAASVTTLTLPSGTAAALLDAGLQPEQRTPLCQPLTLNSLTPQSLSSALPVERGTSIRQ